MRTSFFAVIFISVIACSAAFAQEKGVDSQTQTIKDQGNKVTSRPNDVTKSFNWGKGKTKTRDLLPNPYRLTSRRDALVDAVVNTLKDNKMIVDEASSRVKDGFIVTQPFVFAKGSVITQNELNRYGVLDSPDGAWSRAQYTLTIEVQPIDTTTNNVTVNAKVEGRSGAGLTSEWVTVRSSGVAEDEFLAKLVEAVTGRAVDPVQDDGH